MRLKNDGYIKDFNLLPEHRGLMLMDVFLGQSSYVRARRQEVKEKIQKCLGYEKGKKYLTARDYIEFRMLVDCAVDRNSLLRFLTCYLALDIHPLTKEKLCAVLNLTLGRLVCNSEEENPNSSRIITDVIWFWLKRNKYIDVSELEEVLKVHAFR